MEALALEIELNIARPEDALRFLKRLEDDGAPPELIKKVICRAVDLLSRQSSRSEIAMAATSEIYIG